MICLDHNALLQGTLRRRRAYNIYQKAIHAGDLCLIPLATDLVLFLNDVLELSEVHALSIALPHMRRTLALSLYKDSRIKSLKYVL